VVVYFMHMVGVQVGRRGVQRVVTEWHWFEVFRLVAVCGWVHRSVE